MLVLVDVPDATKSEPRVGPYMLHVAIIIGKLLQFRAQCTEMNKLMNYVKHIRFYDFLFQFPP